MLHPLACRDQESGTIELIAAAGLPGTSLRWSEGVLASLSQSLCHVPLTQRDPCTCKLMLFLSVLKDSACCREGFKDEGGLATASRRFLFTFKGEEYIWQSERESCHVLVLRRATYEYQLCIGASLQLWHAAAVLPIGTLLIDGLADHAARLQSIDASPVTT